MKNILLLGASRCGKSTIGSKLAKSLKGYSYFTTDHVVEALDLLYPDKKGEHDRDLISGLRWALFDREKCFNNRRGIYYIWEGGGLGYEYVEKFLNCEDVVIAYVGKPKMTIQQHFDEVRYWDKIIPSCTTKKSDEEVWDWCSKMHDKMQRDMAFCKQHNLIYIDTSSFNKNHMPQIRKAVKLLRKEALKKVPPKRVGFDMDGTLANSDGYAVEFIQNYLQENNLPFKFINPKTQLYSEMFDWDKNAYNTFMSCVGDQFFLNMPKDRFTYREYFNYRRDRRNKIFIVTGRDKKSKKITKVWLKKNHIKYNKLIFAPHRKLEVCQKLKIQKFYDDSIEVVQSLTQNGIDATLVKRSYNAE